MTYCKKVQQLLTLYAKGHIHGLDLNSSNLGFRFWLLANMTRCASMSREKNVGLLCFQSSLMTCKQEMKIFMRIMYVLTKFKLTISSSLSKIFQNYTLFKPSKSEVKEYCIRLQTWLSNNLLGNLASKISSMFHKEAGWEDTSELHVTSCCPGALYYRWLLIRAWLSNCWLVHIIYQVLVWILFAFYQVKFLAF